MFHAPILIRLQPTAYYQYSLAQLILGHQSNISHLGKFGCAIQVPIPHPKHTKMRPQHRLRIYVGYDSPLIIRYLELMTGDVFTACFSDCQFDEKIFPPLERNKIVPEEQQESNEILPLGLISIHLLHNVKIKYGELCIYKKLQIDYLIQQR